MSPCRSAPCSQAEASRLTGSRRSAQWRWSWREAAAFGVGGRRPFDDGDGRGLDGAVDVRQPGSKLPLREMKKMGRAGG